MFWLLDEVVEELLLLFFIMLKLLLLIIELFLLVVVLLILESGVFWFMVKLFLFGKVMGLFVLGFVEYLFDLEVLNW